MRKGKKTSRLSCPRRRWLSGSCGPSEKPQLGSSAERSQGRPRLLRGDSHLPPACICIHFNAHREREHVFNGNHSKMNYTDSVRDLRIDVHNTPEQMMGAGTAARVGRGGAGTRREGTAPRPPTPPSSLCWDAALKTPPGRPILPWAQAPAGGLLPCSSDLRRDLL